MHSFIEDRWQINIKTQASLSIHFEVFNVSHSLAFTKYKNKSIVWSTPYLQVWDIYMRQMGLYRWLWDNRPIARETSLKQRLTLVKNEFWTWWRHQMEAFSALLSLCAGNSPVTGEFPAKRPVTRSFDGLIDLRLNKRLSKQSFGWWFYTPSWSLWRHWKEASEYSTAEKTCLWLLFLAFKPFNFFSNPQFFRGASYYLGYIPWLS